MRTSTNIIISVSLTVLAGLLFAIDRVARQFTYPKESKKYRINQSLRALCLTTAGGLIATAVRSIVDSRKAKKEDA